MGSRWCWHSSKFVLTTQYIGRIVRNLGRSALEPTLGRALGAEHTGIIVLEWVVEDDRAHIMTLWYADRLTRLTGGMGLKAASYLLLYIIVERSIGYPQHSYNDKVTLRTRTCVRGEHSDNQQQYSTDCSEIHLVFEIYEVDGKMMNWFVVPANSVSLIISKTFK